MSKAAKLAARLGEVDVAAGMDLIDTATGDSLHFDVIGETMCIMHDDGSVNIIGHVGKGVMTVEVIAVGNILKVLARYRPFEEVFSNKMH